MNVIMEFKSLLINELKHTFFYTKKPSGIDNFSFNIIKKCFWVFCEPSIYLFQLFLKKGVFSE